MVEKISVSPLDVRGYGNVLSSKDKMDLLLSESFVELLEDTVDGGVRDVFRMFYNDPTLLFSFDRVEKLLYLNVDDGTLSFSGKRLVVDSNSYEFGFEDKVLFLDETVGPVHSYSLSFSESSYEAVGGSAVLSLSLFDNSLPVENAIVSVTGSDSSSYTATTNSLGVATVTVNNISADTTFTATYSNVSATCTVTIPTYLFYDDCSSSSRLSEYGSSVSLTGSRASTLTYNSSENAYYLNRSTNGDYFTGFKLPFNETDNIRITLKTKLTNTSAYCQLGVWVKETNSKFELIRIGGNKTLDGIKNNTNTGGVFNQGNIATFTNGYYYLEITYQGSNRTIKVYDSNMNELTNWSGAFQTYNNPTFYLTHNNNSTGAYIKEIRVERIQ